ASATSTRALSASGELSDTLSASGASLGLSAAPAPRCVTENAVEPAVTCRRRTVSSREAHRHGCARRSAGASSTRELGRPSPDVELACWDPHAKLSANSSNNGRCLSRLTRARYHVAPSFCPSSRSEVIEELQGSPRTSSRRSPPR